ncbi:MAG TPA: RNA polymerase factor sigma-54 [Xanthobacteraceae bacterium]
MALSQRLQLRQSQALVMTPQLMQAIKLLQLSNLDLVRYVEQELERNPLLERGEEEPANQRAARGEETYDRNGDIHELGGLPRQREHASLQRDQVAPVDAPRVQSRSNSDRGPRRSEGTPTGATTRNDYNVERFVAAETSLSEHLSAQLALAAMDAAEKLIGQYFISLVDENGYLPADLSGAEERLGATPAEVERVLAVLQGFDPPGVCARSLAECISIQLKDRDRFDPAMQALVANLDLLAKRDLAALRKICGVSNEDLADMIAEIRELNPKPGLAFGSVLVQSVVPDIFVRPAADGGFAIELNSDTLPKVLIDQSYHAKVIRTARNERERAYLAECLQNATWLVRALDQRAKTILKVASEIVRQQDGFFAGGVRYLRPLNLKTVAEAIGMHESTVSRVTANKYMATSRGTFELKYFFTAAIAAANGGEAHSAEAVRHHIRELITAEPADGVLSDDSIVEQLRTAGIDIARRTVAKYREAMRIPSSVQRRREKRVALNH